MLYNLEPITCKSFFSEKCESCLITVIGKSYSFLRMVAVIEYNRKVKKRVI